MPVALPTLDPTLTKVLIIRRKNNLVLVEWQAEGTIKRAWIPLAQIEAEQGSFAWVSKPGMGIPFGIDWFRIIEFATTPTDLDRELKRAGIWTSDDLRNNPNAVIGALKSALGLDLASLLKAAKDFEKRLEV